MELIVLGQAAVETQSTFGTENLDGQGKRD